MTRYQRDIKNQFFLINKSNESKVYILIMKKYTKYWIKERTSNIDDIKLVCG